MSEENTQQSTPPGLWRQLVAMIYDGLLIIAMFFIAGFGLLAVFGPGEELGDATVPPAVYQITMELIVVLFYGTFWMKSGQTLGMQAWKIQLVSSDGGPVSGPQVIRRMAAVWLSLLPAGLGYWWSIWDRDHLTWHDRLSGTRIVRKVPNPAARQ